MGGGGAREPTLSCHFGKLVGGKTSNRRGNPERPGPTATIRAAAPRRPAATCRPLDLFSRFHPRQDKLSLGAGSSGLRPHEWKSEQQVGDRSQSTLVSGCWSPSTDPRAGVRCSLSVFSWNQFAGLLVLTTSFLSPVSGRWWPRQVCVCVWTVPSVLSQRPVRCSLCENQWFLWKLLFLDEWN